MAKLSIEDVEHIAKLSDLQLSASEKEKFAHQLSNVIAYVEELNEVKTQDVEVTSQVTGLTNVAAKDETQKGNMDYEQIAVNAPKFKNGSIVVPGVFKN